MNAQIEELLQIKELKQLREKLRGVDISMLFGEILEASLANIPKNSLLLKALYSNRLCYTKHDITELISEKVIQSGNKKSIDYILMYQMCTISDFMKAAIKQNKKEFMTYLLDDNHFYIPHEQKNDIVMSLYTLKDEALLKHTQEIILKSDYQPFFPPKEMKKLLIAIIQSGQFNYLQLAEENLKVNFKNKQAFNEPLSEILNQVLFTNIFFTHNSDIQFQFLDFLYRIKNQKSVFIEYFNTLINQNMSQELFANMLYKLTNYDVLSPQNIAPFFDANGKEEYLNYYKEFETSLKEKEQLENNLNSQVEIKKNGLKI